MCLLSINSRWRWDQFQRITSRSLIVKLQFLCKNIHKTTLQGFVDFTHQMNLLMTTFEDYLFYTSDELSNDINDYVLKVT